MDTQRFPNLVAMDFSNCGLTKARVDKFKSFLKNNDSIKQVNFSCNTQISTKPIPEQVQETYLELNHEDYDGALLLIRTTYAHNLDSIVFTNCGLTYELSHHLDEYFKN
jgi:hypothetical protein